MKIFRSYVKSEHTEISDLDTLVEFEQPVIQGVDSVGLTPKGSFWKGGPLQETTGQQPMTINFFIIGVKECGLK